MDLKEYRINSSLSECKSIHLLIACIFSLINKKFLFFIGYKSDFDNLKRQTRDFMELANKYLTLQSQNTIVEFFFII